MKYTNEMSSSREYAFRFLYQLLIPEFAHLSNTEDSIEDLMSEFTTSTKDIHEINIGGPSDKKYQYALKLVQATIKDRDKITNKLSGHLNNWKIERLSSIDLAILFVGTCELCILENPPDTKIIINEAINLAKRFGGNNSYKFVNGVLDAMAKDEGKL